MHHLSISNALGHRKYSGQQSKPNLRKYSHYHAGPWKKTMKIPHMPMILKLLKTWQKSHFLFLKSIILVKYLVICHTTSRKTSWCQIKPQQIAPAKVQYLKQNQHVITSVRYFMLHHSANQHIRPVLVKDFFIVSQNRNWGKKDVPQRKKVFIINICNSQGRVNKYLPLLI